jgi:molybdenum cofactor guanylyltransferase
LARRALTGVLLVGGASLRFGSPKALADVAGETLAARAWRLLGEICTERLAVGKADDRLDLPFSIFDDGTPVRAPLAGVVAGLRRAANDVSVVLPVDCPLMTAEALLALADACAEAAVPQTGPLPAAMRRTALPELERRLASGRLSLREAFSALETRVVQLDPALLLNVNTRADLPA